MCTRSLSLFLSCLRYASLLLISLLFLFGSCYPSPLLATERCSGNGMLVLVPRKNPHQNRCRRFLRVATAADGTGSTFFLLFLFHENESWGEGGGFRPPCQVDCCFVIEDGYIAPRICSLPHAKAHPRQSQAQCLRLLWQMMETNVKIDVEHPYNSWMFIMSIPLSFWMRCYFHQITFSLILFRYCI